MYVAFDLELVMQQGCRVFKTDEAILPPDWISNECIESSLFMMPINVIFITSTGHILGLHQALQRTDQ